MGVARNVQPTECVSTAPSAASPAGGQGWATLAERLAEEMALCWRQGERPTAADFLAQYEELKADPRAAFTMICEEICLREDYGQEKEAREVLNGFPEWRSQVDALLDHYRGSRQGRGSPGFPAAGEAWTDFQLVAELGRGANGRVFLALEPRLANRPVILKMASGEGGEHLTLARLQHTHIVPLNAVQEDPHRSLRAICMPYFGGASLAQLLDMLHDKPAAQRSGRDLVDALDQIEARRPITSPARGPARQLLLNASYVQAVTWIGACLADALQHAHERGLVHLDMKPQNVLLAADGQPMLLDFHLAQKPVEDGSLLPRRFGGTPKYMSPEQQLLTTAVRNRQGAFPPVDGRSDLYSLGLVLYEALGGELPEPGRLVGPAFEPDLPRLPPLRQRNPQVSVGLADIIHKCLAKEPKNRYPHAAALATDLRRQLSDLPLLGVHNRSTRERWRKWRRRRPHALTLAGMLLVVLFASGAVSLYTITLVNQRLRDADALLSEGQEQMRSRSYTEAIRSFSRGLDLIERIPGGSQRSERLGDQLRLARRGQAAEHLHVLANYIRLYCGDDSRTLGQTQTLEEECQKIWNTRGLLVKPTGAQLEPAMEEQIQADLLDLAILWADLRTRSLPANRAQEAYRDALQLLTEAEQLLGSSIILTRERQAYLEKLGGAPAAGGDAELATKLVPQTAWEHLYMGRSYLKAAKLTAALAEFQRALFLNPQEFWASFYRGQCCYRLKRYQEAVDAFSTCLALTPTSAPCFYNRGLAQSAQGKTAEALLDYDRALQLDKNLAAAALNRGILHYNAKRYPEALEDLHRALESGADAGVVHYNLALVHLARGDRASALESVRAALQQPGEHAEAQALLNQLLRKP
jgi:serine/threonine protein kinase/Flp pilus assembly protein TadD